MDDYYELDENITEPADILDEANAATYHLLPEKSKERHLNVVEIFRQWMRSKNVQIAKEEVVVAYFNGLIKKYAVPILWSTYSIFRSKLFIFEKVDISK